MYEKQMELFEKGGLYEEGGMVDEQSGNEVPAGSTRKEVRDDISARLSEGEFVFPADVVRYIGLDNLMKMRQKAKRGLMAMEEMGQMGNSDEATIPDDVPMEEAVSMSDEPLEFQEGGVVRVGTPIGGGNAGTGSFPMLSYETYVNAEGKTMVIPVLNGIPIYPVPDGYYKQGETPPETPVEEEQPTKVETTTVTEQDDSDSSDAMPAGWDSFKTPEALAAEIEKFNSPAYTAMTALTTAAFGPIGSVMVASNVNGGIDAVNNMLASTNITPEQRNRLEQAKATLESKRSGGIVGRIANTLSNIGKEDMSEGITPASASRPPPPRPPELTRKIEPTLDLNKMQKDIEDIKTSIEEEPEYLDLNLNPQRADQPPPARPAALTTDIEYLDLNLNPQRADQPPPARPAALTTDPNIDLERATQNLSAKPLDVSPASYQAKDFDQAPTFESDDNDDGGWDDFSYDPGAYSGISAEEQLWNKGGFVKRKNKPAKKA